MSEFNRMPVPPSLGDVIANPVAYTDWALTFPAPAPAPRARRGRIRRHLAALAAVAATAALAVTGCATPAHAATVAHRPPAYELSGHPALGHGAETVSVQLNGSVHHVRMYIEPSSGDYQTFALARYDRRTHRWIARFTFTSQDEPGTWYVVSTIGVTKHGLEQRTEPNPAFTVKG
jgi:hypothetical protein